MAYSGNILADIYDEEYNRKEDLDEEYFDEMEADEKYYKI